MPSDKNSVVRSRCARATWAAKLIVDKDRYHHVEIHSADELYVSELVDDVSVSMVRTSEPLLLNALLIELGSES